VDPDNDLQWLLECRPKKDTLGARDLAKEVHSTLRKLPRAELPLTFGLFGPWGSGKTTVLSYLAEMLKKDAKRTKDVRLVYLNAWKYAGFTQVASAIIYRVVKVSVDEVREDLKQATLGAVRVLGTMLASSAGKLVEANIGVDVVQEWQKARQDADQREKRSYVKAMEDYYTQIDRAQDLLRDALKDCKFVVYVLIDEIDRCDPDEALDVIKQLRVFFGMRRLPLVFVLSVNPEPIAAAIRHRYGLSAADSSASTGDFEGGVILEKFVDRQITISRTSALHSYIQDLWAERGQTVEQASFIADLDARQTGVAFDRPDRKTYTMLHAMSRSNYLYSNLRIMEKSLDAVMTADGIPPHLRWLAWHAEMLRRRQPALLKEVALAVEALVAVGNRRYHEIIGGLVSAGLCTASAKLPQQFEASVLSSGSSSVGTLFFSYRRAVEGSLSSKVDENTKRKERLADAIRRAEAMRRIVEAPEAVDFVAAMTAVALKTELVMDFSPSPGPPSFGKNVRNWEKANPFEDVRRLLTTAE